MDPSLTVRCQTVWVEVVWPKTAFNEFAPIFSVREDPLDCDLPTEDGCDR